MSRKQAPNLDPRIAAALAELEGLIRKHYPQARFDVFHGEDPEGTYLRATVDLEDPGEALTPVLDRLFHYQVEEELPVHVVTTRPLERAVRDLAEGTQHWAPPPLPPSLSR